MRLLLFIFSAFGGESLFTRLDDAKTTAIITQKKHLSKVRKILSQLPELKHIIIVDDDGMKPLQEREIAFHLEKADPVEDDQVKKFIKKRKTIILKNFREKDEGAKALEKLAGKELQELTAYSLF